MTNARQIGALRTSVNLKGRYSAEYLRYYGFLPLVDDGHTLHVAQAKPLANEVLEHLERSFQRPLILVDTDPEPLAEAIASVFWSDSGEEDDTSDDEVSNQGSRELDARESATLPVVVRLVNQLVREAVRARASDLHLELSADLLTVRRRVDGIMEHVPLAQQRLRTAVVSRVKLLADLNIAEFRRPQDGRFRLRVDGDTVDVRVSTVPALNGESVVLRLLHERSVPQDLSGLGLCSADEGTLRTWIQRPHGMVVVTGPTGSGKTTTLHRLLGERASEREKLVTVEDPVEFAVPGTTQVPVVTAAGVTFASVLRSILRHDPDVIMVGEMRDLETARIAVQAALTGHLVLSTLHANSAAAAVNRLADVGIEPYLIASTLQGVVAQRLLRRLCDLCKRPTSRAMSLELPLRGRSLSIAASHEADGCDACRGSGFRGRTGIYELLKVSDNLRSLIREGASAQELDAAAIQEGMRTLLDDAADKLRTGVTTLEELHRTLGEETTFHAIT